ncbi:MAG: ABC transporter permease [Gemmataceae bacterium]|nr:ABC transporter permease [Gemmataceae bacterium]
MSYSLTTLWYERQRYLPGVLAVAFSAMLIALQCGLLLGLFSITSIPVDRTRAHIWVGAPEVLSVDLGRPIPEAFLGRLASQPGVEPPEVYMEGFAYWLNPKGGSELCIIMGSRLEDESLAWCNGMTPELREQLTEPGTIAVDATELTRLGITGIGDTAKINGHRVRVVGLLKGFRSLAGPYVFCSVRTARPLLHLSQDETIYCVARCKNPEDAPKIVKHLREEFTDMSAFTSEEFSLRSRIHWLTKTKGGVALSYTAMLGLLVGGVVTSQTLYAATASSLREYAVLRALGIPRWRMALTVLAQSFWVGLAGVFIAVPATFAFAQGAEALGANVMLPFWLLGLSVVVTMTMAMISGLAALRSLRLIDPAILLR